MRPKGCSTQGERASAIAVAIAVRDWLTDRGWPAPTVIDSGNGIHLLYRIGAHTGTETIRTALRYLAHMHDRPEAKVDTSVYNTARVSRMPWTLNRKGEDTTERPHRWAKFVKDGGGHEVTSDHFQSLVAEGAWLAKPKPVERRELAVDAQQVQDFLGTYDYDNVIDFGEAIRHDGKWMWLFFECPFVEGEHEGMELPGGRSKTTVILSNEGLGFKCLAAKCEEHGWAAFMAKLHELSGRKPVFNPYVEWDEKWAEKWGGVDEAPLPEPEQIVKARAYHLAMFRRALAS